MKLLIILFLFTAALAAPAQQTQAQTPLLNRLCHTWVLQKMDDGSGKSNPDLSQQDFRLILYSNFTCKQGLQPDGFITSAWQLDETHMNITISDVGAKATHVFVLKILKITEDELSLQQAASDGGLIMTYKNHDR